jgi:DeoR/GlpR family transcriptional regulator of sugar metabolism
VTNGVRRPESGEHRRARVLARLHEVGVLSVADLARELGVSHMTVRRDLQRLVMAGQVRTVHGGVGLAARNDDAWAATLCERAGFRRVGHSAATLVDPADTIALDAGPSAFELARALPEGFVGAVITHSIPVMQVVAERDSGPGGPGLVGLGGELSRTRQALVGPTTLDAIAGLRARTAFLDADAVDVRGMYARSTPEARVSRRLAEIADRVVLLVPRAAFTRSAPALVVGLDGLTAAVTDGPPPAPLAVALARAGVALHVATG